MIASDMRNVVYFFFDELRQDALFCYRPGMLTPNIQEIASSGTVYDNCFCNSPVCVSSRASLLTSLYSEDMQGKDLAETVSSDKGVRDYALFGYFGRQMNVTDGRYVYMRNASDPSVALYEYTLMPSRMSWRMGKDLEKAVLSELFSFSKNMPLLKIPAVPDKSILEYGTQLFDVLEDWEEEHPLDDKETEKRLEEAMVRLMKELDAPPELYQRLGLSEE